MTSPTLLTRRRIFKKEFLHPREKTYSRKMKAGTVIAFILLGYASASFLRAPTHTPLTLPYTSLRGRFIKQSDPSLLPSDARNAVQRSVFKSANTKMVKAGDNNVTVSLHSSGRLTFSFNITAIPADSLAKSDALLLNRIREDQVDDYMSLRANFSGDLQMPFLSWCGVIMNPSRLETYNEDGDTAQIRTDEEIQAVRSILEEAKPRNLTVYGTRTLVSDSPIPRTYHASIRVADVDLLSGATVRIISSSRFDVEMKSTASSQNDPGQSDVEIGADTYEILQSVSI